MKTIFSFCLLVLSLSTFAQAGFKNGYFISNEGTLTSCLIKVEKWTSESVYIYYKMTDSSLIERVAINSIQEFGVEKSYKFEQHRVLFDQTTDLTYDKNPDYIEKPLLLEVLIEGKASLYVYRNENGDQFFYSIGNEKVLPLTYKKYRVDKEEGTYVGENNQYQEELWIKLRCETTVMSEMALIQYNQADLMKYIISYNSCQNTKSINYLSNRNGNRLHVSVNVGGFINRLSLTDSRQRGELQDLGSNYGFKAGFSLESDARYAGNPWKIFGGAHFIYFTSTTSFESRPIEINYQAIEFSVGGKRYIQVGEKTAIFLGGGFLYDLKINRPFMMFENGTGLRMNSFPGLVFVGGLLLNEKIRLELQYGLPRDILINQISWGASYDILSLLLSYNLK